MKHKKPKNLTLQIPISNTRLRMIYERACVAGGLYTLLLAFLFFLLHNAPLFSINLLIASASYFLVLILIRKRKHTFRKSKLIFFTISFAVITVDFFQDGGIYSPSLFMLVPVSIMLLIIASRTIRLRHGISLTVLIIGLFMIHYFWPSIIIHSDYHLLLPARLSALAFSLIATTTLNNFILRGYILEKNRALESDELKSRFLATMSHMIRTPLNSINGFADFLIDDDIADGEKMIYHTRIIENVKNLSELIDNLVKLSIIQNHSLKINYSTFLLSELLNDLETKSKALINTSGRRIEFNIEKLSGIDSISINSDYNLLTEALWNIIQNAINFTAQGNVRLKVMVLKEVKGIHFNVLDTGIGIEEKQLKQLFVLMNKQRNSFSTEDDKSPGLGLNICHGIIKALHGKIEVASEFKKGTTVSIDIPKCIAE